MSNYRQKTAGDLGDIVANNDFSRLGYHLGSCIYTGQRTVKFMDDPDPTPWESTYPEQYCSQHLPPCIRLRGQLTPPLSDNDGNFYVSIIPDPIISTADYVDDYEILAYAQFVFFPITQPLISAMTVKIVDDNEAEGTEFFHIYIPAGAGHFCNAGNDCFRETYILDNEPIGIDDQAANSIAIEIEFETLYFRNAGEGSSFILTNTLGQMLLNSTIPISDINFDVSHLSAGVYFIRVEKDGAILGMKKNRMGE
jgi:hypothetical protein